GASARSARPESLLLQCFTAAVDSAVEPSVTHGTVNTGRAEVVIAAVVPGRDSTDMVRYVAWALAALLLIPAAGSAEAPCEKGQGQAKPGASAGQPNGKPEQ